MKKKSFYFLFLILIPSILTGQTNKISGWIHDQENNPIIGATIYVKPDNRQTYSDNSSNYAFMLSPGPKQLTARVLGYKPVTMEFWLSTDTTINLKVYKKIIFYHLRRNENLPPVCL